MHTSSLIRMTYRSVLAANKKELVTDLLVKAKQIEYLINSLPEPEAEEMQVRQRIQACHHSLSVIHTLQALRLRDLEQQLSDANDDYTRAVSRARE